MVLASSPNGDSNADFCDLWRVHTYILMTALGVDLFASLQFTRRGYEGCRKRRIGVLVGGCEEAMLGFCVESGWIGVKWG